MSQIVVPLSPRIQQFMLTRLLKADNICDIGHVNSTLQLKTSLAFRVQRWLIFLHHELCLLLVGVNVFAAQQNPLEEIDMVLEMKSANCLLHERGLGNTQARNNGPLFHYPCHCLLSQPGMYQTEEVFQMYPSSEPSSHPLAQKDRLLPRQDVLCEWPH